MGLGCFGGSLWSPGTPLLSVLIRTRSGTALPYLSTVLRMMGIDAPASDAALHQWCEDQTLRAYTAVRTSGHTDDTEPGARPFQPTPVETCYKRLADRACGRQRSGDGMADDSVQLVEDLAADGVGTSLCPRLFEGCGLQLCLTDALLQTERAAAGGPGLPV